MTTSTRTYTTLRDSICGAKDCLGFQQKSRRKPDRLRAVQVDVGQPLRGISHQHADGLRSGAEIVCRGSASRSSLAEFHRRREHSRKPDEVRNRIERLLDGPYIELFARETKLGWEVWGDQTTLFNEGSVNTRRRPSKLTGHDPACAVKVGKDERSEAIFDVAVSYATSADTQMLVFPLFGLQTSLGQNLGIGAVFTAVSVVDS